LLGTITDIAVLKMG